MNWGNWKRGLFPIVLGLKCIFSRKEEIRTNLIVIFNPLLEKNPTKLSQGYRWVQTAYYLIHTKVGYNCENHKKLIVKQNPNVWGVQKTSLLNSALGWNLVIFLSNTQHIHNSNSHVYHKQVASLPLTLCKQNKSQAVLPFTLQLGQVTKVLSTYLTFSLLTEYFKT